MDYKNLFNRLVVSSICLFLYFISVILDYQFILYLIIIVYFFIFLEVLLFFKNLKIFYILYLIISFVSFILYFYFYFNIIEFNLFILIVITFDIFSYIFGIMVGKKRIFKKISPNKTYSGLLGGLIISNLISIIYILYFNNKINVENILYINSIILFAFSGDVIESYFKRINNLKDSSNFLPGHGGFLDRFDSFILVIIFIFIYNYIIFL